MNTITLYEPNINDLWFKKEIKEDPLTMDYNAGYNVSYDGYNFEDGTIKTDLDELKNIWSKKWLNNWPQTYYSYIVLNNTTFIGEIYAKYHPNNSSYEIGIVIKGEHRGNRYSIIATKLLCEKLKNLGAKKLFHEVPSSRIGAIKSDLANGFKIIKQNYFGKYTKFGEKENLCYLELNF